MKKQFLSIMILLVFLGPLSSFKPIKHSNSTGTVKHFTTTEFGEFEHNGTVLSGKALIATQTTTYVGDNQTASRLGRFYAVYTNGGTSIIQVVDYATMITYTATGTFTPGTPGHFPTGSFTVTDNGVNIDNYSGTILF